MRIGCHVSIRGGYLSAAQTAAALGAESYQYFPKNPRSLSVKEFDRKDAEACAAYCKEKGLLSIAHTPYPVNLAVPPSDLRELTVQSLRNDLMIAEAIGSLGIVVHFGKSKDPNPLQSYQNIIQCINEALADWKGQTLFLLENQAGEGTPMGTTLEELVQIRKLCDYPEKVGFCLDTCHLFASGVWTGRNTEEWVHRGKELGFWDNLIALHLNDSVYPSGAHKDRHANISKGYIGEESFRTLFRLISQERPDLLCVLETSAGPDGTHRGEIRYVRTLLGEPQVPRGSSRKGY